ncbi:MAG: siphovirus Gp157 family protein [Clostridiales bacterium]|nr:siphovirus Gp157 family protein [Clostridiales bacterium]
MTLYQMSAAAKELYELLESGEIDEQTVNDTMESIGASEKLESYVYVQKSLEAEIAAFKAEIDRMTDRKRSLEKQVERLQQAQIDFMAATGQKSANAGTFKLTMRENKSCEITNESEIPLEFLREVPAKYEPDKNALKAALKSGKEIPGCTLKTSYSVTAK